MRDDAVESMLDGDDDNDDDSDEEVSRRMISVSLLLDSNSGKSLTNADDDCSVSCFGELELDLLGCLLLLLLVSCSSLLHVDSNLTA